MSQVPTPNLQVEGADADSSGFDVIDEWGRMVPDPDRWPSSVDGNGFTEVANKVHSMGLKFGIHVMRGISTQAVNANTLILDTKTGEAFEEGRKKWTAQDIGIKERPCSWMPHGFMSVNTTARAGAAFLRSLYTQYAEWGVDFGIFAAANMIGATGLKGKSWPDLDMLPLGWLTDPESNEGPHRITNLTPDEQKSQVTLWSMAKSPLMFGGDVRNLDNATYYLITNEIFPYVTNGARSWIATGRDGEVYLAFFNVNTDQTEITAMTSDMAKSVQCLTGK
ncbi:alpha-galactosidase 3 [Quercus suber]|uniref:Alpha-galactosidase n=1 Tax=Quercus suber TaxID=58331 RepID=A0AAW0LIN3_QUESU